MKLKRTPLEQTFLHPDPLLKGRYQNPSFRLAVLSQLLPVHYLVTALFLSATLFLIPIGLLMLVKGSMDWKPYLLPILISSSLFYCFYSLLLGVLFINSRIPFLKEWKEKLGFHEL
ncbi:hypothetical protein LPTSP4_30900 [Leptospira ryugenii]|uniref:Uncharacterized protein n=1 Tax=Leptospira ryugenii TaxID=1917863 RepID=A0A2P2E3T1_9LEPT|nr:hypothetical protein [Leptospira ryugenii]GBF51552.1 hypothetical protein LPTSP4_30900 [Leptospira ryugenii]